MFKRTLQLFFLCLALLAIGVLTGGPHTPIYGHQKHPTLEDHCFFGNENLTIKLHDSYFPPAEAKRCVKIRCDDDYLVTINNCQWDLYHCDGKVDYTKQYPDCCKCA